MYPANASLSEYIELSNQKPQANQEWGKKPGALGLKLTGITDGKALLLMVTLNHRKEIIAKHVGFSPGSAADHLYDRKDIFKAL